jgi:RNA polymerase sigma-70 factor (ECF subfamily)
MSTAIVPGVTSESVAQEFEELFREHYQLVYRTAYSLLDNSADAEDVLQTVFLKLLRRELPPDLRKNVKGYLYRAAVNRSLDIIRTRRRLQLTADTDRLEIPFDSSESDSMEHTHRRLAEAFAGLEPEAAHILILRYVHDYSDSQIAKLLGTSRGAIAVRLFRSRARLKKLMRKLGERK